MPPLRRAMTGKGQVEAYDEHAADPRMMGGMDAAMHAARQRDVVAARGSQASVLSAGSASSGASGSTTSSRRNDSGVRQAVRAAAAQVAALQKESRSRARAHTPDPLGTRRPNVEALPPPARPNTSGGALPSQLQQPLPRLQSMGPRSQQTLQRGPQTSQTWELLQRNPAVMLKELASRGGADLVDSYGWSCLHFAALHGKTEHVVALLDSGADALRGTTGSVSGLQTGGERGAGLTAVDLARAPAEGVPARTKVLKMLLAAEQGHWAQRCEYKRAGDVAVQRGEFTQAVESYSRARQAVAAAEVYDSPALNLVPALREAKKRAAEQQAQHLARAQAADTAPQPHQQQVLPGDASFHKVHAQKTASHGARGFEQRDRSRNQPQQPQPEQSSSSSSSVQRLRAEVGGAHSRDTQQPYMQQQLQYQQPQQAPPPQQAFQSVLPPAVGAHGFNAPVVGGGVGMASSAPSSGGSAMSHQQLFQQDQQHCAAALREAERKQSDGDVSGAVAALETAVSIRSAPQKHGY
jgi:hypothetical protein